MALTVSYDTPKPVKIGHGLGQLSGTIAFDSSYPTGGESFDLSGYFKSVYQVIISDQNSGYLFEYDYTNKKIKVMYPRSAQAAANTGANQPTVTSGAATASAVDATTPTVTVPSGFRSAVDAAVGSEVSNGTNLSSLTGVRFVAIGRF